MDSLTQIVLGAAVSNAAVGKKAGNRAVLWGAIGGTIPDLDVFFNYTHSYVDALALHRGFSHSLLFSLILAPALGWLVAKLYKYRRGSVQQWIFAMFLALATHPMLDAFTTWGTSLWWPFTEKRVAISSIFVLDPLYTIPFLVCLVVSMCYIKNVKRRAVWNYVGLGLSSVYLLSTVINQQLVYKVFEKSWENQGVKAVRADVKPTPMNTLLWTANIETDSSYCLGYYSWLDKDKEIQFNKVDKNHALLKPFLVYPEVQQLLKITVGYYVVEAANHGLNIHDLRFGQLAGWESGKGQEFVFTYRLHIEDGKLTYIDQRPNTFEGVDKALLGLIERITGHESSES